VAILMEKIKAENLRKIFITKERRGIFKGEKRRRTKRGNNQRIMFSNT